MEETTTKREQIRQFVIESLAKKKGVNTIADTDSLTENGVLDSLAIFRLVTFLEDTFQVRIADEEITHENFQSIECIEKFVLTHGTN